MKKRNRGLTPALVIGVLANAILLLLLAFAQVREQASLNEPIQVKVSSAPKPELPRSSLPKPAVSQITQSASAAQAAPLSATTVIELAAVSPVVLPTAPDTIPDLELTGTRLNSFGTAFSASVDPGKVQRGSGNGSLFGGAGRGAGEEIGVLVDISGSMKRHSSTVGRLIKHRYPKIGKATVAGCSLRRNSRVVAEISKLVSDEKIEVIVFVCDLQDGLDAEGMLALWGALNPEGRRIRLSIISFEKAAQPQLADLLEQLGGSVYHGEETIEKLIQSIAAKRREP